MNTSKHPPIDTICFVWDDNEPFDGVVRYADGRGYFFEDGFSSDNDDPCVGLTAWENYTVLEYQK